MGVRIAGLLLAGLALAACSERFPARLAVPLEATRVTCVNTVSGFSWDLRLDPAGRRVDGWPAAFRGRKVDWRDGSDGAGYTLDRVTGLLTIMRASSTGGVANVDNCKG